MLLQGAQEPRTAAIVAEGLDPRSEGLDLEFQVKGMEDETLLLAVEALRNAKNEATLPAGAIGALYIRIKKGKRKRNERTLP